MNPSLEINKLKKENNWLFCLMVLQSVSIILLGISFIIQKIKLAEVLRLLESLQ